MRAIVLMLAALAASACSDPPTDPGPDAFDARFGSECPDTDTSPIVTCETPAGVVGWCVIDGGDRGTCRRACRERSCPDGETPTIFGDGFHCYCQP